MAFEQFHYTLPIHDDETGEVTEQFELVIRKYAQIPFGFARKNRRASHEEQLFRSLELVCTEEQLKKLDHVWQTDIIKFLTAWQKGDGKPVTPGESEAS